MTVEEHGVTGGAVAEVLAQCAGRRVPFAIMGVRDGFCSVVGSQDYLRAQCGLSVNDILVKAKGLLCRV